MTFLSYVTGSVHTLCQEKITRFKNDNSSYRKSGIAEILLKVALNTKDQSINIMVITGYKKIRLIRSLKKFIFRYQYLVEIYSVSAEIIISDAFSYSENV